MLSGKVPAPISSLLFLLPAIVRWRPIIYTTRKKYWFRRIRFVLELIVLSTWSLAFFAMTYEHGKDPDHVDEKPPYFAWYIACICVTLQTFVPPTSPFMSEIKFPLSLTGADSDFQNYLSPQHRLSSSAEIHLGRFVIKSPNLSLPKSPQGKIVWWLNLLMFFWTEPLPSNYVW